MDNNDTLRFCLVLVCLAVCSCGSGPEPGEPMLRPVRYVRVVPQGTEDSLTFSGTTKAELETNLSFKVGGTLTLRNVDVGDVVGEGDEIAVLDPTDYRVRLQEAEAGLALARAELRNAEASYERTRGLYENRNASRSDLDAARAAAESAQAGVRASEQQREAARLQLSYTRLNAPQACTVAQVFVELNQNVSAGQSIVRVNCGECSEVTVSVPEVFIGRVTSGSEVAVSIDAFPDEEIRGVVTEVGIAAGATGTTFPVIVALRDRCADMRSGMAADVLFRLAAVSGGGELVVPFVSVGEDSAGRFVFVLEPDDDARWFVHRRPVSSRQPTAPGIIIVSGLSAGELIATAGVRRLTDGQQVVLLGDDTYSGP